MYYVRVIWEFLRVDNVGFIFFLIFYLSDGGYIENLVFLFLLKWRLKKILVVDGGIVEKDLGVVRDLFIFLE